MASDRTKKSALSPTARLLIGASALLLILLAIAVVARLGNEDDSIRTRQISGVPGPLPAALLPTGASNIKGTLVEQSKEWLSAAVEFTVVGTDRDAVAEHIDAAVSEAGWMLYERVYDASSMIIRSQLEDGSQLTVTLQTENDGVTATVIAVRNSSEQNVQR